VFTKLNLKDGDHHILMREGDEHMTALQTRYGHYQFQVMPFRLVNTPATFQMNKILREFLDHEVVVYQHDILIYSENMLAHIKKVRQVLDRLEQHDLALVRW